MYLKNVCMLTKNKIKRSLKYTLYILTPFVIYYILGSLSLRYFDDDYLKCVKNFVVSQDFKRVIVFIAHQDDDLFVAGPLIYNLRNRGIETKVVFFTDGNAHDNTGKIRQAEAIEANGVLGVPVDDVICMGFPNRRQADKSDPKGTSTLELRDSMKTAIKDLLNEFEPQLVVCSDFDFNRDHRLLTILFDESVGELLKEKQLYRPVILKGFSYQTSYNAVKDFYNINMLSTKTPQDVQNKLYETDVPAYAWNSRIRIPIEGEMITHSTQTNILYKALKEYRSVWVRDRTPSIINGDNVFWLRRSDNLLLHANITASSGNTQYLNDFKLYDTNDLTIEKQYNVDFVDYMWEADVNDINPCIQISLLEPHKLKELVLYDDPQVDKNVTYAEVFINGDFYKNITPLHDRGIPTSISINYPNPIDKIEIKNIKSNSGSPALVEIELFEQTQDEYINFSILKLKTKDSDDFLYKYYVKPGVTSLQLDFYALGVDQLDIEYSIVNDESSHARLNGSVLLFGDNFESCKVRLTSKYHPEIFDEAVFMRESQCDSFIYSFMTAFDKLQLDVTNAFYRNRVVGGIVRHTLFNPIKRQFQ